MTRLSEAALAEAAVALAERDADLGSVVARYGPPPMWGRPPGFPTLLQTILEQQVSLASAAAAFTRLGDAVGELTPESFLSLDDQALRAIGFSRQKTRYGRILAGALLDGSLDLDRLECEDDETVRGTLTSLTGIGPWTADTYLLMALGRPDIWPVGDIALQAAVQDLKRLPDRPSAEEMVEIGEAWRPWRAVAARILWFHYLDGEE